MATKVFAPNYQRDESGFIHFPRDVELRRELFCPEAMAHPAKANLYLLQAIIDHVSEPGDKLLDPMSGTGSLMMATLPVESARSVWLIEDAPVFHYQQTLSKEKFVAMGVPESAIMLLHGPCQEYLPLTSFFDHVIFSPPYANVMVPPGGKDYKGGFAEERQGYEDYKGASDKNLGRMSTFFYNQEAAKVYRLLLESLKQGGTMTVVVQDKIKGGKREGLSDWVMRTCIRAGFELLYWEKRYSHGSGMKNLLRSKGVTVVEDEDIIGFRKP